MTTMEQTKEVKTAGLIFTKIPKIMGLVGAISKDRVNARQGYKFRGIDDVYNALNEHLSKEKVFSVCVEITNEVVTERESQAGGTLFDYRANFTWRIYAEDGSFVETMTVGKGMDSGDKDANKAMSAAYKYAFLQVFCIPTDEPKDSENDDHEVKPKTAKTVVNATVKQTVAPIKVSYQKIGKPVEWNGTTWQRTRGISKTSGKEYDVYFDINENRDEQQKPINPDVMDSYLRNNAKEVEEVFIDDEMDRQITKGE